MTDKLAAWEKALLYPTRRPRRTRAVTSKASDPKPPKDPRKAIVWYKKQINAERELVHLYAPENKYGYLHPSYKKIVAKAANTIRLSRAAIKELRKFS